MKIAEIYGRLTKPKSRRMDPLCQKSKNIKHHYCFKMINRSVRDENSRHVRGVNMLLLIKIKIAAFVAQSLRLRGLKKDSSITLAS